MSINPISMSLPYATKIIPLNLSARSEFYSVAKICKFSYLRLNTINTAALKLILFISFVG